MAGFAVYRICPGGNIDPRNRPCSKPPVDPYGRNGRVPAPWRLSFRPAAHREHIFNANGFNPAPWASWLVNTARSFNITNRPLAQGIPVVLNPAIFPSPPPFPPSIEGGKADGPFICNMMPYLYGAMVIAQSPWIPFAFLRKNAGERLSVLRAPPPNKTKNKRDARNLGYTKTRMA